MIQYTKTSWLKDSYYYFGSPLTTNFKREYFFLSTKLKFFDRLYANVKLKPIVITIIETWYKRDHHNTK